MKKKKVIILVILLAIIVAGIFSFYNFSDNRSKERLGQFYQSISLSSKMLFLISIVLIAFFFIYLVAGTKKIEADETEEGTKEINHKIETDLDKLFSMLQDQNTLSLFQIMEEFNVDKKTAMDWIKILESGDLIYIDYPLFGSPNIRLKSENINIK